MKRIILLLLPLCFLFISGYSQSNKNIVSNQIKNEMLDSINLLKQRIYNIENHLILTDSSLKNKVNVLTKTIDTVNKSIDDSRLRESLKSAESTLTKQNYLINGFSYLLTVILIIIAIGTIIFSVSLAKSNRQTDMAITRSNNATDRLNDRIDYFDEKINNQLDKRFDDYEERKENLALSELFRDLKSKFPLVRKVAIEKLSALNSEKLNPNSINELFDIILLKILDEEEKTAIIEVLIRKNDHQILNFLKTWYDVKTDNKELKSTLLRFYIENHFSDFINPITHFILDYASPHKEFNDIISNLSSHTEYIYMLINHELLIKSLTAYSKSEVKKFINEFIDIWGLDKEKINNSLLFNKNKK